MPNHEYISDFNFGLDDGLNKTVEKYLNKSANCVFCGREIYGVSNFYDAQPLHENSRAVCCQFCHHAYVVPFRKMYLDMEYGKSPSPFPIAEMPDSFTTIKYRSVTHAMINPQEVYCKATVVVRGRSGQTRRVGTVSDIDCPKCLEILIRQYGISSGKEDDEY